MAHFKQYDDTRSVSDLYVHYPYCMKHEEHTTRPSIVNCTFNDTHSLSMRWTQFHKICKIYFKYLALFLMSGNPIDLPYSTGTLQLHKYKYDEPKRPDFAHYAKTGEWKYHQNHHTHGYIPMLRWHKDKAKIKHKYHWGTRFVQTFSRRLSKEIKKDPNLLLSCSDNPNNRRVVIVRNT